MQLASTRQRTILRKTIEVWVLSGLGALVGELGFSQRFGTPAGDQSRAPVSSGAEPAIADP